MVGAGPPPLWGRGRQGRNTVAAETGSLRLEFPSCYGPELRNPQQLCLTRQLLQSPSLYHLPLLPLKPLLLPGYKHTQHMAAPGLSTLAKTPGGRSHRHILAPCPATCCWGLRGPLTLKAQVVISCHCHVGASFTQLSTQAQPISEMGILT